MRCQLRSLRALTGRSRPRWSVNVWSPGSLVHVPEQPVEADVQAGPLGSDEVEALGRAELAGDAGCVRRVRGGGGVGSAPPGVLLSRAAESESGREQAAQRGARQGRRSASSPTVAGRGAPDAKPVRVPLLPSGRRAGDAVPAAARRPDCQRVDYWATTA